MKFKTDQDRLLAINLQFKGISYAGFDTKYIMSNLTPIFQHKCDLSFFLFSLVAFLKFMRKK